MWSEFGLAPPFPPVRVLDVSWSRALSLVCEVALSTFWHIKMSVTLDDPIYSRGTYSRLRPYWQSIGYRNFDQAMMEFEYGWD